MNLKIADKKELAMDNENEVYRDKFCWISHDKELLSLVWLPSTKDMTVEDFKACNLETACLVEKLNVKQLLVDVEFFGFKGIGPDVFAWRATVVIPKYHAGGLSKIAFVHGADFEEQDEKVGKGELFTTRHLSTRKIGVAWLCK
jgi:hypothetical protein